MKILYIITQADMGGAQKSALLLASHFHGEIAAGTDKTELFVEASKLGIKTHKLRFLKRGINPIFDLPALVELYFLIKKIRPDIVHLNSSKAGFLGSIAGKLAGTKVIFTARGFVFNEPHSKFVKCLLILLEKFASYFRDQIITVSQADELSAKNYKIIDQTKLFTIHNAIPQIKFLNKAEAKKILNVPFDKFIIGTIANLYPTKGLDILISAAAKLPPNVSEKTQFALIGSGPVEQNLKLQTTTYKLQPFFHFAGQIPDASLLLKAFDMFVLPSRKEGFPLVLLEAMQAGLPIIATDVGGNKEALADAGILVEPQNPEVLAQAIMHLIANPSLCLELSQKAQLRSGGFGIDNLLSQTQVVYSRLL